MLNALMTFGALSAATSVVLGAFGAHALDGRLDAKTTGWWQTATLYALVHAVGIIALGIGKRGGLNGLDAPAIAFSVGIVLFSGSLYAMALGAPRWFGAITPLGGLAFLAGWALLIWIGLRATAP